MQAKNADWYRHGWSLDIKNQSWVQDTERQVAFLIRALGLSGNERILDLACGYGRHALSFARKGFSVVGVDITQAYIDDAEAAAQEEGLAAQFLQADIRDVTFANEFDVVLNMADGAIGYLETDAENLKIFDVIARALKPGGKHFMDVCNAQHAAHYFPKTSWEAGEAGLSLAQFDWNPATRRMLYGGCYLPYGAPAQKPEIPAGNPTRLYDEAELADIFAARGMEIVRAFSDYDGAAASAQKFQLLVYAAKR